jgi:hypothetical protein
MASPLTPKQWIIIILVNVVVSIVTTLVIVRVLMNQPLPKTASASNVAAQQTVTPAPPTVAPQTTQAQTTKTDPTKPAAPAVPTVKPAATSAPTNTPARTSALTTATPAQNSPSVRISAVLYPGQRQREVVVIVNEGNEIDLKGWTLTASRNFTYTFGDVTLFKDSFINLHTTGGADVPTDLFWNRTDPAWQTGDVLTLANKGQVIATFTVK